MALSPVERKAALLLAGVKYRDLAAKHGFSAAMISVVVNGRSRSDRVEAAIAQAIARPRDEVFPPRTGTTGRVVAAGAAQ
jgi:hypothetical protein